MDKEQYICCVSLEKKGVGVLRGILYGLIPHTFCIAFIIFSVIGSVTATALLKNFLIIPYFFTFLVLISFLLATFSAFVYLKKAKCFCISGVKRKWKYLVVLYLTMIVVNLALFVFIFPALANMNSGVTANDINYNDSLSLVVKIPCSGHASLIADELKRNNGVGQVVFSLPNIFNIKYNSAIISPEKILSIEIFKTYEAVIR